jgi:hypothetical protein
MSESLKAVFLSYASQDAAAVLRIAAAWQAEIGQQTARLYLANGPTIC